MKPNKTKTKIIPQNMLRLKNVAHKAGKALLGRKMVYYVSLFMGMERMGVGGQPKHAHARRTKKPRKPDQYIYLMKKN